ncbi:MAG: GNAT family N-acetyltransferase [Candidatus Competibacteraceae bacterium]|nr:GNAT family N-acetyltransferase [Candidatus Competibacteraceae bacterium]
MGIGSISTDPLLRRSGHASQLLHEVVTLFHERDGGRVFFLHADVDPKLYNRLGFIALPDMYQTKKGSVTMMYCSPHVREKLLADPEFKPPAYF